MQMLTGSQVWSDGPSHLSGRAVCYCSWSFFWHDCETGTSEDSYWISSGISWIYPCNLCEYKAITQGILKTHNESVHGNVQYTCNLFEYKRKQQGHLNTHIESVHEKVRYPCIQCHKEFITQGYLKIYIESVQLCKWEI